MTDDIDRKITYDLGMTSHIDLRPAKRPTIDFALPRVEIACPEFNWFLHEFVGVEFRWGGREEWRFQEWLAYADRPELETWVGYVAGTPAGYYEFEQEVDGSVQIKSPKSNPL